MLDIQDDVTPIYDQQNQPRPILIVLSGPSGVGKDTTLMLLKRRKLPFYFVVTATPPDPAGPLRSRASTTTSCRSANLPK